jgi:hypothetical protein
MAEVTVAGLANAEPLSDVDMFLVSQPEAYNPFTESPGDTRKVTLSRHIEYLEKIFVAREPFGYLLSFDFEPSAEELAMWRCLPLAGQMINFVANPEYRRLCDRKYAGDANNATADWWYKTSDPAGLIRDVNGAYLRVLDHRGLFSRAAGQNSKYRMASDTPYDGGAIGAYLSDAIRDITGYFTALGSAIGSFGGAFEVSETEYVGNVATGAGFQKLVSFRASRVSRIAEETRPGSISAFLCIKY